MLQLALMENHRLVQGLEHDPLDRQCVVIGNQRQRGIGDRILHGGKDLVRCKRAQRFFGPCA